VADFDRITNNFKGNAESVYQLLTFDSFVLDHVVGGLTDLADTLEKQQQRNAARVVSNRVASLKNIRHAESLRPRYQTIFNQCVVLLVSYFGSAVHALFSEAVSDALTGGASIPAAEQEVKLAWRELNSKEAPLASVFSELLVAQRDISFQDMQSIGRAFKDHLGVEIARDEITNDIILGQACRHVIVHAGGIVDRKMLRQLSSATPRRLKLELVTGVAVAFEPQEVMQLGATMSQYIERLTGQLVAASAARPGLTAGGELPSNARL